VGTFVVRTEVGGITVAVGELVAAAAVNVETIYRRLRKNRPKSMLKVMFEASSEFGNSTDYATLIVWLVVLPLFALEDLEGRTFALLGWADFV